MRGCAILQVALVKFACSDKPSDLQHLLSDYGSWPEGHIPRLSCSPEPGITGMPSHPETYASTILPRRAASSGRGRYALAEQKCL